MAKGLFLSLVAITLTLAGISSEARPLSRDEVPEPLRPWIGWVLRSHEESLCPFLHNLEGEKQCAWPSPLHLSLDEKSGRFAQGWRLYADGWVPLPGDDLHWPQAVRADGQPVPVILLEDRPQVYLKAGEHSITGTFLWDSLPESFPIPTETGALQLAVRGVDVGHPNTTDEGVLWLQAEAKEEEGGESLEARIHRRLEDDIPFVLTTVIDLDVSGKTREVVFAPLLSKGFAPMALDSPLPAHLEKDGSLKVQVRSGHWKIRLSARHEGPVTEITAPNEDENQRQRRVEGEAPAALPMEGATLASAGQARAPINDIWVFEPRPELRLAKFEGGEAIDPQQTTLPDEWKRLAAYRVKPGETIYLKEQRRGDSDPAPDQLNLTRDLWLDFDGSGFTLRDQIGGTFNRPARLEMASPVSLGRVSVDGQDQLITRLAGGEKTGIEVHQGDADIDADSRIENRRFSVPAIGWNRDFQNVTATLHLPPGWRAWNLWGADRTSGTWLDRWTLLDLLLVVILSFAFAKIWNVQWGGIALAAFLLSFPEKGAPQWSWLAVLLGETLDRLLPIKLKKKITLPLRIYRTASLVLLLLVAVPFGVLSLRNAAHPSLERIERPGLLTSKAKGAMRVLTLAPPMAPAPAGGAHEELLVGKIEKEASQPSQMPIQQAFEQKVLAALPKVLKKNLYNQNQQIFQQVLGAQVQTGPGLPRWDWSEIPLQWNGAVTKDQRLRLLLCGPRLHYFLTMVNTLLIALLLFRLFGFPGKFWPAAVRRYLTAALLLTTSAVLSAWPSEARADFPTPEILNDLRERLLEGPECSPTCASIPRLKVEATPTVLRLRLEVAVGGRTALPLPANPKEWIPRIVSVNGRPFAGVRRSGDDQVWLELPPGVHQVLLEGGLADFNTVQIPLPLKPHHVEATLQGWNLEGIHENGEVEDNLQLTRTQPLSPEEKSGAAPTTTRLPPFVRMERRLTLGLTWNVETRVVRLTPTGSSIVLEVPLLPGESVTTEGIRVQNGKALVSMGTQAGAFSWSSILQQAEVIDLHAPDQVSWVELWEVDAAPVWHVDSEGIPRIRPPGEEGGLLQWRPWPGEKVTLKISRPEGAPGQTLTIDKSFLSLVPGPRFTEATLSVTLRSSLGGQHTVTIPPGAEIQSVTVNGEDQPIRAVDQKIPLPLTPGTQGLEIKWQQTGGVQPFYRTPAIDIGAPSVNADIQLQLPKRWVLLLGGPRLGPTVVFWCLLVLFLIVAVAFSRTGLTPLKTRHWILLGLGLTQVPILASAILAGGFLLLGWRSRNPRPKGWSFDLLQILLAAWALGAMAILLVAASQGLTGNPDMQVLGNDSTSTLLKWFQDRSGSRLPRPWVLSLPVPFYRIAMLGWAGWAGWILVGQARWAWGCFSKDGLWRPIRS